MRPLEIVADLLLVIGAALAVAAGAVVALWLGLLVGAVLCLAAGIALTALSMKKPRRPAGHGDRGPFEPTSAVSE